MKPRCLYSKQQDYRRRTVVVIVLYCIIVSYRILSYRMLLNCIVFLFLAWCLFVCTSFEVEKKPPVAEVEMRQVSILLKMFKHFRVQDLIDDKNKKQSYKYCICFIYLQILYCSEKCTGIENLNSFIVHFTGVINDSGSCTQIRVKY